MALTNSFVRRMRSPDPALPFVDRLAFSLAALPVAAVLLLLSVYLPRHAAGHLGIPLGAVGVAFLIVRLIDIPVETLLGWGMDATRTPVGRYRPWMVAGLVPLMLGVGFVTLAPPGVGRPYLIAWLLVLYLGMSMLTVAHLAWASTLAPKYHERSRMFGLVTASGVVGAAILIVIAAHKIPDGEKVPAMGRFVLIAAPIAIALMLWRTPERLAPPSPVKFRFRDYAGLLARPAFSRLVAADLCVALGPGWMGATYLFFFTNSRGFTTAQASLLLGLYIIAGIVGAPTLARLAMRIGKPRTLIVSCLGFAVMQLLFMAMPKGSMPLFGLGLFVSGFFASSFTATTRAMTADVADEVRLERGRECTGLLYAMTTTTQKITGALSIGLSFAMLARVGYVAKEGAVNTPAAIHNLELVYLVGPISFVTLGAVRMLGYPLTAARHAAIRRALDARDAQPSYASEPDGLGGLVGDERVIAARA